jgi:hypothetical protein
MIKQPLARQAIIGIGEAVGLLETSILVIQEGGYRTRSLGANARHFFGGLWAGKRSTS